jgi:hypothetical protein
MCCGSGESTPVSAVTADPEGAPSDDQMYRVSYFDGTTEDVQGIDTVKRRLLDPSSRDGGDRGGVQGGSYARI